MPRLAHVAATFAIVLLAFWAYRVVAVPLIEPSAEPGALRTGDDRRHVAPAKTRHQWAALFPPGAWELNDPRVLTMDQVQLVYQKYESRNGLLHIEPFTIIFTPDDAAEPADAEARAIVLRAPPAPIASSTGPICRSSSPGSFGGVRCPAR